MEPVRIADQAIGDKPPMQTHGCILLTVQVVYTFSCVLCAYEVIYSSDDVI